MKLDKDTLLDVLRQQNTWVDSTFLTEIFNVSSRTIRNYVSKINENLETPLIESCHKGYHINLESFHRLKKSMKKSPVETPEERVNYIVRKLISSQNTVNFFDLAEELFVSDSTLQNDIKRAKSMLQYFNLRIVRNQNIISIEGGERNKRKLIHHLISIENNNNFMAFTSSGIFFDRNKSTELSHNIPLILQRHHIYINDFGLNNIILHLLVTIDRIQSGKDISGTVPLEKVRSTKNFFAAMEIKAFIESILNIDISDAELYYLTLNISSNSNPMDYSFVNAENINDYLDEKYILITKKTIQHLEETYYLEPFDDAFIVKLTIHIHNLFQRAVNNAHVKNPLTIKIKTTYPLIYDMAVFVANEIRGNEKIFINEDEIAFIAFHIGTYMESNKNTQNKVSCIFVYTDYHNMHQPALVQIKQNFENDLNIIAISSIKELSATLPPCDLIISTVDAAFDMDAAVVQVNVFLTQRDIERLREEISAIKLMKKSNVLISNINRFIGYRLFEKEFYAHDEFEMIELLTYECYRLGLCNASFKDEILERESLSSTSFNNSVAVPHSLKHNTLRSFLSVVINEKGMQWGNHLVHVIILIGINKDDHTAFQEIFDDLIAILCEPILLNQLIKCQDYDDFINTLTPLMLK
ncbi:MAG: hypothetical protein APF77_15865 [Clostridia bacterium BRH_c25]|nr:MAG: hypothetical protein APF77_15865 [Clostridia bacterium BRH_c25]